MIYKVLDEDENEHVSLRIAATPVELDINTVQPYFYRLTVVYPTHVDATKQKNKVLPKYYLTNFLIPVQPELLYILHFLQSLFYRD